MKQSIIILISLVVIFVMLIVVNPGCITRYNRDKIVYDTPTAGAWTYHDIDRSVSTKIVDIDCMNN